METVVLDHHEVADIHPHARALVNPKRKDALFPTRELAACGVTFFFLIALRRSMNRQGLLKRPINLKRQLDLVALGTVADMVPLTGDNRVLVKFGMEMMQKQPREWLKSFFRQNLIFSQKLDGYALPFIIIPRINAAGRVAHPMAALEFLTATGEAECAKLLEALNGANRQRQGMEESIIREALGMMEGEPLPSRQTVVLYKEDWPVGVIGIAAQKLAESQGKPCIIFTKIDGTWKGSARSVPGLDLYGTVSTLSDLLVKFGGHKFACGLSVDEANLPLLPGRVRRGGKGRPSMRRKGHRHRRGHRVRGPDKGAGGVYRSACAFRVREPAAGLPARAPRGLRQQRADKAGRSEEPRLVRERAEEDGDTRLTRREDHCVPGDKGKDGRKVHTPAYKGVRNRVAIVSRPGAFCA